MIIDHFILIKIIFCKVKMNKDFLFLPSEVKVDSP